MVNSPVGAVNGSTNSAVPTRQTADQALGQEDFLQLMLAQLQNQDPMKPMDNNEFLGQMAQFSTVQGITGLQGTVESLAASMTSSQLLDATSLIGRDAMIFSPVITGGDARPATIEVPAGGPLRVQISNASGELVQTLDLGTRSAGSANFTIPELPEGSYAIQAVLGNGNAATQLDVLVAERIRGVALDRNGGATILELGSLGSVPLSEVRQIREES